MHVSAFAHLVHDQHEKATTPAALYVHHYVRT